MNRYENEAQILKQKLYRYKKNEKVRIRALFLLRVIQAKLKGTSVYIECEKRGENKKYFYFWLNRLRKHNYDIECLQGYSKKPHRSPNEISEEIIDRAEELRGDDDIGGHTLAIMLKDEGIKVSGSTICSHLKKKGISKIYKYKKVNGHNKRYSAENPLERTQTDSSWSGYEDNHGNRLYLFPVIDDCSRVVTVHVSDSKCSTEAVTALEKFIKTFGRPDTVQTDNGVEFTNKYISENNPLREKQAKISAFEEFVRYEKIRHYLIRLRTPQLNGKVERFNQTIKKAMKNRLYNGVSIQDAQIIVDEWVDFYNRKRPHHSLNRLTPYQKFFGVRLAKSA